MNKAGATSHSWSIQQFPNTKRQMRRYQSLVASDYKQNTVAHEFTRAARVRPVMFLRVALIFFDFVDCFEVRPLRQCSFVSRTEWPQYRSAFMLLLSTHPDHVISSSLQFLFAWIMGSGTLGCFGFGEQSPRLCSFVFYTDLT
jgi:hypothetical protein